MHWNKYRYRWCCFLFCLMVLTVGCGTGLFNKGNPVPTQATIELVDASQEPDQVNTHSMHPFVIKTTKGSFNITPVAEYRVAAMIVGVKEYSSDWNAQISPMDFVLAWGHLAKTDYDTYIKYDQRGRWYYYHYNKKSPLDGSYIASHSANNHIIPATANLKKRLAKLEVKQTVLLEGYLVNIDGDYDGKAVRWRTSMTRVDSGDGACEVMYVKKLVVNGLVYE